MPAKRTGKPQWDKVAATHNLPPLGRKINPQAKLKNLSDEDQETLWRLMNPEEGGDVPYTLERAAVFILSEHGFEVALSTISEWRRWYQLRLRMANATERAEQVRLELAKDPSITAEGLERSAQIVFTAEALEGGNLKGYVQLARLNLAKTKANLDRDKLTAASKTEIERGLEALLAEIQGNPKALAIFKTLQAEVAKG